MGGPAVVAAWLVVAERALALWSRYREWSSARKVKAEKRRARKAAGAVVLLAVLANAGCMSSYPAIGPFSAASVLMRHGDRAEALEAVTVQAQGQGVSGGVDLAAILQGIQQETKGASPAAFWTDIIGYAIAGGILMYSNNDDEPDTGVMVYPDRHDGLISISGNAKNSKLDTLGADVYVGGNVENVTINTGPPMMESE
jgi:hypothetical protein